VGVTAKTVRDHGCGSSYTSCIVTKEWTLLEPGAIEFKAYCPDLRSGPDGQASREAGQLRANLNLWDCERIQVPDTSQALAAGQRTLGTSMLAARRGMYPIVHHSGGCLMSRAFVFCLLAIWAAPSTGAAQTKYKVVSQLPAGDGGWDLLSVAANDQRLYVAHGDGVTAFDLRTGKATDKIVSGQRVHAALAIPGTHDVISTNGEANNAILFDGRTGQVRAIIPTGTKPDAAAWDPATRTVWIMDPGSGDVTVVDPASARIVATIPVGGSLELGIADGHGKMFVNVEDKNEVAVLDTRSRKVERRFPLEGCDGPTGIAYDPTTQRILSACANGIAVVSRPDGKQVAKVPIGRGADGAAFDPVRHLALVPGGRDGNLTLVRLSGSPRAVGQVTTAVSARTIALDLSTGRAYLPSATLAPALGKERPKPVPGTFRVLVVSP